MGGHCSFSIPFPKAFDSASMRLSYGSVMGGLWKQFLGEAYEASGKLMMGAL